MKVAGTLLLKMAVVTTLASGLAACGEPVDEAAAARGQVAADTCMTCHSFDNQHKIGPHLRNVLGRAAGTVPGYEFSEAMKNSHIVWTEETLAQYLKSPLERVPGTKMALTPLTDQQVSDIVEFIKSQD